MPRPHDIVILAKSGRALAQSARRGGWRTWVVDAFADGDTRACAAGVAKVAVDSDGLCARDVLKALNSLVHIGSRVGGSCGGGSRAGVIYGSGIEAMPALLERLADSFEIIGNGAEVVRNVKDPRTFFARLDELGIAHPVSRFTPPENERGNKPHRNPAHDWLVKRAAGSGGEHVHRWDGGPVDEAAHYFQQFLSAPAMSALFIADGRRARIVGYNTQWQARQAASPFIYGGAINRARLSPSQRALIVRHVSAITEAFGLRGLNSLDFVVQRGQPLVLEINPRPGATCELYEPETPEGMLALHAQACDGELPRRPLTRGARPRAHTIVYADRPCWVPAGMRWPRWCHDLPVDGADIAACEPVCSVVAEDDSIATVSELIDARRGAVLNTLAVPRMAA